MDTSAVYGLFEELKQSLTEMTTSLKGRSEPQTIDLSKIEELFGKINTLSKQEVFSPEQIRILEEKRRSSSEPSVLKFVTGLPFILMSINSCKANPLGL